MSRWSLQKPVAYTTHVTESIRPNVIVFDYNVMRGLADLVLKFQQVHPSSDHMTGWATCESESIPCRNEDIFFAGSCSPSVVPTQVPVMSVRC